MADLQTQLDALRFLAAKYLALQTWQKLSPKERSKWQAAEGGKLWLADRIETIDHLRNAQKAAAFYCDEIPPHWLQFRGDKAVDPEKLSTVNDEIYARIVKTEALVDHQSVMPEVQPNSQQVTPSKYWMTISDAAAHLHKSAGTISRWASDGTLQDNGKTKLNRRVSRASVDKKKYEGNSENDN